MTANTNDLRKLLGERSREIVDVNLGQVPLTPTQGAGGQYNVQVRATPKTNAFTQLATAFAQLPQLAGAYKQLQQVAGIKEVQEMSDEQVRAELKKRADEGDTDAWDFFKQEAVDRQLYSRLHDSKILPAIQLHEKQILSMSEDELNSRFFYDEVGNQLADDQIVARINSSYQSAINDAIGVSPDGDDSEALIKTPNQRALHNQMIRNIPSLSVQSLAKMEERRQSFINDGVINDLFTDVSNVSLGNGEVQAAMPDPEQTVIDKVDVGVYGSQDALIQAAGAGDTLLPSEEPSDVKSPNRFLSNVTVYSPQKPGSKLYKMEGGYEAARPGLDGESIVRTVDDYVSGKSNYITLAGDENMNGRVYVIPELPVIDKATGEVTDILTNVTGYVHDTGSAFENKMESKIDIPLGRDLTDNVMGLYNAAIKNVEFVRDRASESKDLKPVKITAKAAVQQSKNLFNQRLSTEVNNLNIGYNRALFAAQNKSGSEVKNTILYDKAKSVIQDSLMSMIQDGNDIAVEEFIESARSGEITLGGQPYDKGMIVEVTKALDAEEARREREKNKPKPLGTKRADALMREASRKWIEARDQGLQFKTDEEVREYFAPILDKANELRANNQIGQKEYNDIIQHYSTTSELARKGLLRESSTSQEFKAGLKATTNQTNARFHEAMESVDFLKRAASRSGIDIKPFVLEDDIVASLSPRTRERYDSLLAGTNARVVAIARDNAFQLLDAEYEKQGITDPNAPITVTYNVTDLAGKETEVTTSGLEFYQYQVENEYNKKLKPELAKVLRDKTLIDEADRLKKGGKQSAESERVNRYEDEAPDVIKKDAVLLKRYVKRKLAEELNKELEDTDVLEADGRVRPQVTLFEGFDVFDKTYIDRWKVTLSNEKARQVLRNVTDRNSVLTNLNSAVDKFHKEEAIDLIKEGNQYLKQDFNMVKGAEIMQSILDTSKVLGIPMTAHENKGIAEYEQRTASVNPFNQTIEKVKYSIPFDYNTDGKGGPLYSRTDTPKTHVYNMQALQAAMRGDITLMSKLFNIHFAGNTEGYTLLNMVDDQLDLAYELGLKTEKRKPRNLGEE